MAGICNRVLGLSARSAFLPGINTSCDQLIFQMSNMQIRAKRTQNRPKLKYPFWYLKKERTLYNEHLTESNIKFIEEMTHNKFGPPAIISGLPTYQISSPLKEKPMEYGEWNPKTKRCGLITRKIGCYPMWKKNGDIIWSTLLQVVDNHVVKYTPPEEVSDFQKPERFLRPNKYGILLVGAESSDPQKYTREYCGLFANAGLPPKKVLGRFNISPEAALQPGTPLYAMHFQPGDVVDVVGTTISRGFQGVMKRWGFKGMPASHGVTKTHRKAGNIGGGGEKGRVWPGTKLPGHMGNRKRYLRGLKIWRINTKFNILYVQGLGVPGETNSIVYVHDTVLPLKKKKTAPLSFPTYFDEGKELADDLYDNDVHCFNEPTLMFEEGK
ncbi:39S ribosomal protein L3, mitochondrial [Cimex lectularius]|uniref:Large ribosomal subunit protein uL3m n=1 Tax=Cimex lectularius TaxID=79782 RepID=A0A8I6RLY6_CIMLE|nr:39S ribosomal protein L3, mitochondrial [Cimex lectularius]